MLTYPGLAIKGIAAVGPTLDVWGQLEGEVTVAGSMRVGATYTFKPIEIYMPNNDETRHRAKQALDKSERFNDDGLQPDLQANVEARVQFGVLITPEVNLGIKVGGPIGKLDATLVDAHVLSFINTTLRFYASAKAALNVGWSYEYGVKLLYRVGFAAMANVMLYGEWKTAAYYPFAQQEINIYGPVIMSSTQPSRKRSLDEAVKLFTGAASSLSAEPLPHAIFPAPSSTLDLPEPGPVGGFTGERVEYLSNASTALESRQA